MNANVVRGRSLFLAKVNESKSLHPIHSELIEKIAAVFCEKVGVMPTKEADSAYGANRLSKAITEVVLGSDSTKSVDDLIAQIDSVYGGIPVVERSSEISGGDIINPAHVSTVKAWHEEINSHAAARAENEENVYTVTKIDPNTGEEYNCEMVIDVQDLSDEYEVDELTTEGLRSRGFIHGDFDTEDDADALIDQEAVKDKVLPMGRVRPLKGGAWDVVGPNGETDVYMIDSRTYGVFDSEVVFRVAINLPDFIADRASASELKALKGDTPEEFSDRAIRAKF